MKSSYKRYTMVGPGGLACACCAPQSGTKYSARARTIMKRQAKRREAQAVNKEMSET
jgi:hypothetical protein